MAAPKHVYETYIQATTAQVWAAITQPDFTRRYFHRTAFETDLQPGSEHRYVLPDGTPAVDGVIEEVEKGKRLVMTWHVLYDDAMAAEPPSRVEWILRQANEEGSVTRLTLRHFDLALSPLTSGNVALGWVGVIDGMKTLLETGEAMEEITIDSDDEDGDASPDAAERSEHRRLAIQANGETWELLAADRANADSADDLLERAYASAYHWRRAADADAVQHARAAWMIARCHTVAGNADQAMHFAKRCADLTSGAVGVVDFDQAYAHEALARAHALAGNVDDAARERAAAKAVVIEDPEDRGLVESDLAAGPWFSLA